MDITFFRDGMPVLAVTCSSPETYRVGFEDCDEVSGLYDEKHYFKDGKVHRRPPPPSDLHTFDYKLGQWIQDSASALTLIRDRRNRLLADCDWTALSDAALTGQQKAAWVAYRQALRDITKQPDPFNIVWPTPPT